MILVGEGQDDNVDVFSTEGNEQENGQSSVEFKGNLIGVEVEKPDL